MILEKIGLVGNLGKNFNLGDKHEKENSMKNIGLLDKERKINLTFIGGSIILMIFIIIFSIQSTNTEKDQASIFFMGLSCILLFVYEKKMFNTLKYLPCPYCEKSVKMKERYQCDSCNSTQKKEQLLSKKCDECGEKLKTAICEHCHQEFEL